MSRNEILDHRKNRFLSIGRLEGFTQQPSDIGNLSIKRDFISIIKTKIIKNRKTTMLTIAILFFLFGIYYLL
jgi:acetyl-CoA carboxylase carboxyl transferase subunit alpha